MLGFALPRAGTMPSQRDRAEQLFQAALDIKPAERAAFLDRECIGNPELRQAVEDLLAQDADAGSFLKASAIRVHDGR